MLIRIRVGHSDTDTLPACPGPGVAALEKAVCFWQAADVWWRLVAEVDRLLRMRMDECPLRSGVASPRRFFFSGVLLVCCTAVVQILFFWYLLDYRQAASTTTAPAQQQFLQTVLLYLAPRARRSARVGQIFNLRCLFK